MSAKRASTIRLRLGWVQATPSPETPGDFPQDERVPSRSIFHPGPGSERSERAPLGAFRNARMAPRKAPPGYRDGISLLISEKSREVGALSADQPRRRFVGFAHKPQLPLGRIHTVGSQLGVRILRNHYRPENFPHSKIFAAEIWAPLVGLLLTALATVLDKISAVPTEGSTFGAASSHLLVSPVACRRKRWLASRPPTTASLRSSASCPVVTQPAGFAELRRGSAPGVIRPLLTFPGRTRLWGGSQREQTRLWAAAATAEETSTAAKTAATAEVVCGRVGLGGRRNCRGSRCCACGHLVSRAPGEAQTRGNSRFVGKAHKPSTILGAQHPKSRFVGKAHKPSTILGAQHPKSRGTIPGPRPLPGFPRRPAGLSGREQPRLLLCRPRPRGHRAGRLAARADAANAKTELPPCSRRRRRRPKTPDFGETRRSPAGGDVKPRGACPVTRAPTVPKEAPRLWRGGAGLPKTETGRPNGARPVVLAVRPLPRRRRHCREKHRSRGTPALGFPPSRRRSARRPRISGVPAIGRPHHQGLANPPRPCCRRAGSVQPLGRTPAAIRQDHRASGAKSTGPPPQC